MDCLKGIRCVNFHAELDKKYRSDRLKASLNNLKSCEERKTKMIKLENVEVVGFEAAIREMRNLRHSSPESDSVKCYANANCLGICKNNVSGICIVSNDLDLMTRLCHNDTHRSKLMRTITIYVDVTAPLYWWRDFDTVSDKKNHTSRF